MLAEDRAHGVRDFADRGLRFDGGDDRRHQVRAADRGVRHGRQRPGARPGISPGPERTHTLDLATLDLRIDPEDRHAGPPSSGLVRELVDADDDGLAGVDGQLRPVRGFLNLALDEAGFDGGQRAAGALDLAEEVLGALLDARR